MEDEMATTATGNELQVNVTELEGKVKAMYQAVAEDPGGNFHFDLGRALAERLGYAPADLDAIPAQAVESFAGVGYYFDLLGLRPGETVVDLGSGSGMDAFIAAGRVGSAGTVIGIDMTDAQLAKAERLRQASGASHVRFRKAYIDATGLSDQSTDAVISNGVINLAADKAAVFREAARVLTPGGRLALSDIVTEKPLPSNVTCNATLWAACIGGAMQIDEYVGAIESAGLRVRVMSANPEYRFLSKSAQGASRTYGVRSISLLAIKG
jgi:ubiquinone/menaquinone biosynthesis C-methylase UbiE